MSEESYAQWSILELLGHRRLAGYVTEHEIAGKGFLRIDIPRPDGTKVSQLYNPDSVYGLTPTTEEIARKVALSSTHEPVSRWELADKAGPSSSGYQEVEPSNDPDDDDGIPY